MSKTTSNLSSYENFELLENFPNQTILNEYRTNKLVEAKRTITFLKKSFSPEQNSKKLNVLDLGSGNSKLLFQFEKENMLNEGYGVEISKSRYDFAEKWKNDENIQNVKNINSNILGVDFTNFNDIDIVICEDYTLQFLEPLSQNSVNLLLSKISSLLNENGILLLELSTMNFLKTKIHENNGTYKTWEELEITDPFAFLIQDMSYDNDKNIIINKKFIHKLKSPSDFLSQTTYVLKPYAKDEITKILKNSGFSEIQIYENFDENSFQCQPHECYVVIAKKI